MSSLTYAYDRLNISPYEPVENPQFFDRLNTEQVHPNPSRHVLGLVGGNEASMARGNVADVESDLKGITRPNSDCAWRKHLPQKSAVFHRKNPKISITVDGTPVNHLKSSQFWAYPAVVAPEPMIKETCGRPEKY
jgi:hypothetical protein